MGVTQESRKTVHMRSGGKCEKCGALHNFQSDTRDRHHVYWRLEYKKSDRNEPRNGALLCGYGKCHYDVHNGDIHTNRMLKAEADIRKPKKERSQEKDQTLEQKKKMRKKIYQNQIDRFRKTHDGLSPSQYAYRKQKERAKKNTTQ